MALFRKGSRLFSVFYVTACRYLHFNDLNHVFTDGFSENHAETAAKLPARRRRGPSAGPGPDSCIYNLDTCGPGEKGAKRADPGHFRIRKSFPSPGRKARARHGRNTQISLQAND